MSNLANLDIKSLIYTIIALLVAIIPHEIAHGYVAYLCGDTTAKDDGRLSLNPLNHIDPVGLISMIVFRFGWAKAVPINPNRFKGNRKMASFLVSIAGVCTNLIIGTIVGIILVYLQYTNSPLTPLFFEIFWYNIMLGVFNLVPLPPLDGSKVIATLLPTNLEFKFYKYEKYFYIVLVVLLFSGVISKFISPIIFKIINTILALGINLWNTILF
ncbi:site-2 protease family protein [Peptoniphilus sp. MSJ-1]|uniref:Site-2 protease family protein n=1 Tax=Peptoniphilus ovalis TaxID=2841503 RepID=A0ABS6FG69_9FIRM|nr:site-2 protease family protein [Peptoniphilus ovalis]MBU5669173.1 site-2 protease family protein [Peptoniphilus ovalis]